jgi:predicted peroxiredoxin
MTREQSKYLFTLTTFDSDPDRIAAPLVLANSALAGGADVLLWLTLDGVRLGRKGAADAVMPRSFPPVAELLKAFVEQGGRIGVCPPCAKTHGVTDDNRVQKSEWMGAAAVLDAGRGRQAFSF